ncbi:siderophore-interacting protein [Teichococcus oryzae]|uniref:Siderophore-interacting protein n=1 Tax=Teichococcus oryzae TaxID=1608942 RepID=A0A5B2TL68_9PROT|nr:siderophore-interacting protein [Pseudoroseomonas oryzae]KAA2214668.1 siderophore-interacting protein [Pseudoroseomonas oryzae]
MTPFIAEARAHAAAPAALLEKFLEHMVEHGLTAEGPLAASQVAFPGGKALLRLEDGGIALRIEAESLDLLSDAKASVAGHLEAFAPDEALGIVWAGAGAVQPGSRPHNFRAVRVLRSCDITPRMRRITLRAPDLHRFESRMMHVKILIPGEGSGHGPDGEPLWPRQSPSGQAIFDGCALTRRTYTIRRIDAAAGELDIDFVLHGDASPGSRFALRARPGDWLGLTGPGGGDIPVRGWTMMAGDETALPAIARALEGMAPDARGVAMIEVADAAERQDLAHPPGVSLRWLFRDGAPCGAMLLQAALGQDLPEHDDIAIWAACEAETARSLRTHWGGQDRLRKGRFRAAAYWRRGVAEGSAEDDQD